MNPADIAITWFAILMLHILLAIGMLWHVSGHAHETHLEFAAIALALWTAVSACLGTVLGKFLKYRKG